MPVGLLCGFAVRAPGLLAGAGRRDRRGHCGEHDDSDCPHCSELNRGPPFDQTRCAIIGSRIASPTRSGSGDIARDSLVNKQRWNERSER
jgi:hypothetical protein